MERAEIDAQLAQAADLFRRGELEAAEELFAELSEEYQRHNFPEGNLALSFNRLLVALERGERAQVHSHLEAITATLREIPRTPWVSELAENVIRLLSEPIPGIVQSTIDETVQAARMLVETSHGCMTSALEAGAFQSPMPFEALRPCDAAFAVIAAMLSPSAPEWMRPVRRALGPSQPLPTQLARMLEEEGASAEQQYQKLTDALEWAILHSPYCATALQLCLAQLESQPLPKRLSFLLDLPLERRAIAGCLLHDRVARALSLVGGAEELARGQWLSVRHHASEWQRLAELRMARGSKRIEDAERRAETALCWAQAELALTSASSLETARSRGIKRANEILAPSINQAELHGIEQPVLSARVLRMGGFCAELSGDPERAKTLYRETLVAALPALDCTADFFTRARVLEQQLGAVDDRAFVLAVEALLGLCRIDKDASALALADQIISFCRSQIGHDECGRLRMHLELCRGHLGEPQAGMRALGVAAVLEQKEALGLAHCLAGFELLRPALSDHLSTASAVEQFEAALECALKAPKSAMRSTVVMAAAMAYALEGEGLLPGDCSAALLKAAEALAETGRGFGAGEFDVYLLYFDVFKTYGGEAAAAHLIKSPGIFGSVANEISAAICASLRRQKAVLEWAAEPAGLQTLDLTFAHRVLKNESLASLELPLVSGVSCETAAVRAARGMAQGEIRVEFTVFDQWTAVHLSGQQLLCRGYRLELTAAQLDLVVNELLSALAGDRLNEALLRSNQLFDALCAPCWGDLQQARRVTWLPDGPLLRLPFGVLGRGQTLCDIFDMAVALEALPALPGPGPTPLARCAVLGDADVNALDFSTLVYADAFEDMRFYHDEDLAEAAQIREACNDCHCVVLFGDWTERDGEPCYMVENQPVPVRILAEDLALGGVSCAMVMGPLEGELGRRVIRQLLSGVRSAVVVCHRTTSNHQPFTMRFLPGISQKRDLMEFYETFGGSRRGAAQTGSPMQFWSSFELYVAA